jgi:hypothetical protein
MMTIALGHRHWNVCSFFQPTQLADLHRSQLVIGYTTPGIYRLVRIEGQLLPYPERVTAWILERQLANRLDESGRGAGQYTSWT